ncbi:MAG TPA: hypothetical protein DCE56_10295 [Cyanobacteria bacterium UBA8553]|nr:hypothetical protein [Cyanobacteria bacterium UBA8553]
MATWVGIFVNNIDENSLRELEIEADDEITAMMLLDLYNYDETWQHYSFIGIHKKEVRDIAARNSRSQKQLKEPVGVSLVHADIKSLFTTLICIHCFCSFCLCKSSFYYKQFPAFNKTEVQVHCQKLTPSKRLKSTRQHALQELAFAE